MPQKDLNRNEMNFWLEVLDPVLVWSGVINEKEREVRFESKFSKYQNSQ